MLLTASSRRRWTSSQCTGSVASGVNFPLSNPPAQLDCIECSSWLILTHCKQLAALLARLPGQHCCLGQISHEADPE